jgi:23S rRNA pseudouridine2605 synthase
MYAQEVLGNKKMHKSRKRRTNKGPGPERPGRAQKRVQSGPERQDPASSQEVRLHKFLADNGVASRRKSEELITRGLVKVNGKTITELGTRITATRDKVSVDGHVIRPRTRASHCYYILNKPRGFLVTADDPEGRKTIYDLVGNLRERLIPVGRLDRNSEGLLLLTDDGELAHRLMHPSYEIEKEYEVRIFGKLNSQQMEQLREGVELDDHSVTGSSTVTVLEMDERGTRLSMVIKEGKKRQVRRMLEALGQDVKRLMRVREGSLRLGDLSPGKHRKLNREEVARLKKEAGLSESKPRNK